MNTTRLVLVIALLSLGGCSDETPVGLSTPRFEPPELPTEPGQHELTLRWDGEERDIVVLVPPYVRGGGARPLMFALHGGNGSADGFIRGRQNLLASACMANVVFVSAEGALTVDGVGRGWNPFDDNDSDDDLGYFSELIPWLVEGLAIDPARVFVSGYSNGGAMTQRIAAELPHLVRAAASVCHSNGYTYTKEEGGERFDIPDPVGPVSVLMVRGGADNAVPADGTPNNKGRIHNTAQEDLAFWLEGNACDDSDSSHEKPYPDVEVFRIESCAEDASVHFWFDVALGHEWPDAPLPSGLDVNQEILDFFLSR